MRHITQQLLLYSVDSPDHATIVQQRLLGFYGIPKTGPLPPRDNDDTL